MKITTSSTLLAVATLLMLSSMASAFSLSSLTVLPRQSPSRILVTGLNRKHDLLTTMHMGRGYGPHGHGMHGNRRMLAHVLGAGLAFPMVANAKFYDKLAKLNDLDPMDETSIDKFFSDDVWGQEMRPFFSDFRSMRGLGNLPNVQRTDTGYDIKIEAPGIKKEDLKVELVGKRSLVVSANVEEKGSGGDTGSSSFQLWNEVDIPRDADISKLKTKYDNGLLTVSIPRTGAADKSAGVDDSVQTARVDTKSSQFEQELKQRLSKIDELREELERERQAAREAKERLGQAKRESMRPVRKQIDIE